MFTGLMMEPWRQAAMPESWHSLFPPVQVSAQLCLAVVWGFLLLARSLPTAVVQGGAPFAASGRDKTKTRGKLSWLPGACGCHVFLPLTLLFSAHLV